MSVPDATGAPLLFLSHAGADTEAARRLKARLEEAGLRVWFDKDDLRAGEKWRPQLEEVISRRATAFAVYIGSKGVVNWVEAEVDLALSRAIRGEGHFPFIPILTAGAEGSSALPGFAKQFQSVRDVESNPEEFQRLVAAVLGKTEAGTLELEKEPFFGLKAIDETRSHLFFGRERETQELVERLATARLLMVTGDSGSGKSSLVRAGLVPRWRGGALAELKGQRADEEIWHVIETRPRANPRRALGEAVNDAAQRLGLSLSDRGTLKEWAITGDIEKVRDALRCDLPADHTRTLLVVDQFEELWTLTPPEQRQPFVDLLLGLSDPSDEAFAIVLTMRRDYYNLISEFPALHSRLEAQDRQARYLLGRMQDEDLRRIVTEPLKLARVDEMEREALAQAVRQDVGTRPGDLALVQFALTETWRLRGKYRGDLLQAYVSPEVGRVEGALARAAERVYEQVLRPEYSESEIEAVFIRLVRLGDTGGASRRLARRREFDDRRWAMLQTLADEKGNRLVLISGSAGDERAEIAHEALVTQWPRFQRWLQAGAGDKRTLDLLIERVGSWAGVSTESSKIDRLATGAELTLFLSFLETRNGWISSIEREYVQSSHKLASDRIEQDKQRDKRERNRIRIGLAIVSLLLMISLVAGVAATVFWRTTSSTLSSLRLESAQRLSVQGQQFLDAGDIDQSASSLLEAAKLLSEADAGAQTNQTLSASLVRAVSTIARKPLPIPARQNGIFLTSLHDDTLVINSPKSPGLIEIWKAPSPDQAHRVAAIDLKTKTYYYAIDLGRREIYTFVVGDEAITRWSLSDGSSVGKVRSPVLPKDYSGAIDFRVHLGGLIISDGEQGAIFDPTQGTVIPATPEILAEFDSERLTDQDIDRLQDVVSAQPSHDIVGEVQFFLREFGGPQRLAYEGSCRFAVSGANDGVLKIWDAKSGTLAKSIEIGDRIAAVSISPTCDMVASFGFRTGIIVMSLMDSSKRYHIFSKEEHYDHFEFDESGSSLLLINDAESSIIPVPLPSSIARNANVLSDVIDFVPSKDYYLVRTIKPTRAFQPWTNQYYKEDDPDGRLYFSVRDAKTLQPHCTAHVAYPEDALNALDPDDQNTFTGEKPVDEKERDRVNNVIDGKIVLITGIPCSYFLVGVAHHVYALELVRDTETARWEWRKVASLHSGYRDQFPNYWTLHDVSLDPETILLYTDDGWQLFRRDPGTRSWLSVPLDDRHFGMQASPPPNNGNLEVDASSGLPSLNYLGFLAGSTDLLVLSTSTETLIVDRQGHTRSRFSPASGCRQIVARTRRGDLLIQEYEGDEGNGCKPQSFLIGPEKLSLHPISEGYLATPEQSADLFMRVHNENFAIIGRDGRVRCELPNGALAKVEIYYPTVSQIDVRARMRILAGGFYFGPAWHGRQQKTKILIMEEAGYFVASTNTAVIIYQLTDCKEVGRVAIDDPIWSVVAAPISGIFVTVNGDRSYSIWDATKVSEVYKALGVAEIRNVIGDDTNIFSIEGIRNDLNFLRVDPTMLVLAKQANSMLVQKLQDWKDAGKQDANNGDAVAPDADNSKR